MKPSTKKKPGALTQRPRAKTTKVKDIDNGDAYMVIMAADLTIVGPPVVGGHAP